MTYKTLTLQIYKPSRRKRQIMDEAMLCYARALESLLAACREGICAFAESDRTPTKAEILALAGKDTLRALNAFGAEPFKDSLKMEFSALALAYIGQRRKNRAAKYPCVYESPDRSQKMLEGLAGNPEADGFSRFEREYRRAAGREERSHPVYFGRYDTCRDYCLLYDEYTGRFYAKLYLLNAENALKPEGRAWRLRLRYVSGKKTDFPPPSGGERYLILPLAFGKKQREDLLAALANPEILHTARLQKKNGSYYLLLNIECGPKSPAAVESTLGVARAASGGLHYTVCAKTGKILAKGEAFSSAPEPQRFYILTNEIVRIAVQYAAQTVAEADGGFDDDITISEGGAPLRVDEYKRVVSLLSYKLPEKGLPKPVCVSAKGLYSACPKCGCKTRRNRPSGRLFACVECGFAATAGEIGSLNLANTPGRYRSDKIPIYAAPTEKGVVCYNRALAFECLLPDGRDGFSQVYYELDLYARSQNGFEKDPGRYAMLRKLRGADDIRNAVRIVPKKALPGALS